VLARANGKACGNLARLAKDEPSPKLRAPLPFEASASTSTAIDVVCSSRELFGADRSALRLATVLRDLRHRVRLVVPDHRPELGLTTAAEACGIAVEARPVAIASSRGVESVKALLPDRGRAAADVTIFNTTAVMGVRGMAPRRILMIREWLEPRSPRHRALALRHRIGLDGVVAISGDVRRQWRACVRGPATQVLIPNWLDDEHLPDPRDLATGGRGGIVCLGRFNAWKGQEVLAEAYERAFASAPAGGRQGLTFVGAQPDTPFAAASEAIAERGRRWGWSVLPFDRDPTPYLDAAALLVLPSLHPEPFGMVVLEALARGCRVLAFPGGGPDDLAGPFAHALSVVPRSAEDLGAGLQRWWRDGGTAQGTEEAVRTLTLLRDGWSHSATLPRWDALLTEVLAR
jgi:glycosyltransferase involved in cell wall biosynthesis